MLLSSEVITAHAFPGIAGGSLRIESIYDDKHGETNLYTIVDAIYVGSETNLQGRTPFVQHLNFQDGDPLTEGINGVTPEALIAIVAHELGYNEDNVHNEEAIRHLNNALNALHQKRLDEVRELHKDVSTEVDWVDEVVEGINEKVVDETPVIELFGHHGNPANNQISITLGDEPNAAGAHLRYEVTGFDTANNPSVESRDGYSHSKSRDVILFQGGDPAEHGVNGITHEVLMTILIHRLECLQSGPFSCRENAIALTKLQESLMWLKERTAKRIERGVEGKQIK